MKAFIKKKPLKNKAHGNLRSPQGLILQFTLKHLSFSSLEAYYDIQSFAELMCSN